MSDNYYVALRTILDAGKDGSITFDNGTSIVFYKPEDAIPISDLERVMNNTADATLKESINKLIRWWKGDDE